MATVRTEQPAGGAAPHNLEAEQSVLGAIMLSDRSMYGLVIEEGLRPDDFYRDQHRLVYAAMLELYEASHGIDAVTVTEHLRQQGSLEGAGGEPAIHALAGSVPAAGNVRHYAQIVKDNARVTSSSRPSSGSSRSPTTTARRTSGASTTSSTRRPTSSTSSRSRGPRSPAYRRGSRTWTRSPAASSAGT